MITRPKREQNSKMKIYHYHPLYHIPSPKAKKSFLRRKRGPEAPEGPQ